MITPLAEENLLPEIKLINNYIDVATYLLSRLPQDCDLSLLSPAFNNQLLTVQDELRHLKQVYINSLKFQSYE